MTGEWPDSPGLRFLIRQGLRRGWLCEDHRVRGGCSNEHGPEGSCPECPLNTLDDAMRGPLGGVIERAHRLMRRKEAGFLLVAEKLPADVVAAVQILHEERQAYLAEQRDREEEIASVKREMGKRG